MDGPRRRHGSRRRAARVAAPAGAAVVETREGLFTPRLAGLGPGDGRRPPTRAGRTDDNAMLAALARSHTDETH